MTERDDKKIQLLIDYKMTFGTESGERVLADMKSKANFDRSVIPRDANGRIDPMEVMRNEGQRSGIVHIEIQLGKDPHEQKQEKAKNE